MDETITEESAQKIHGYRTHIERVYPLQWPMRFIHQKTNSSPLLRNGILTILSYSHWTARDRIHFRSSDIVVYFQRKFFRYFGSHPEIPNYQRIGHHSCWAGVTDKGDRGKATYVRRDHSRRIDHDSLSCSRVGANREC